MERGEAVTMRILLPDAFRTHCKRGIIVRFMTHELIDERQASIASSENQTVMRPRRQSAELYLDQSTRLPLLFEGLNGASAFTPRPISPLRREYQRLRHNAT